MTTWIIISICLYLIGMVPTYMWASSESKKRLDDDDKLFIAIWPLFSFCAFILVIGEYIFKNSKKVKL